jgi:hypothetical protein
VEEDGRRWLVHGGRRPAAVLYGGGGTPVRKSGDGGVHELQEVEGEVMACSDWAMGEWGSGSTVSCCSPGLEGMAAAF